jgi:hypothetical protein
MLVCANQRYVRDHFGMMATTTSSVRTISSLDPKRVAGVKTRHIVDELETESVSVLYRRSLYVIPFCTDSSSLLGIGIDILPARVEART